MRRPGAQNSNSGCDVGNFTRLAGGTMFPCVRAMLPSFNMVYEGPMGRARIGCRRSRWDGQPTLGFVLPRVRTYAKRLQ
jgi:hypothetical protein